jgi:hypothetical protein
MPGTRISLGDCFVGFDCPLPVTAPTVGDYVIVGGNAAECRLGKSGGAAGDRLQALVCIVEKSAVLGKSKTAVTLQDGEELPITLLPAGMPLGVHRIEFGAQSRAGGWSVSTGSDVRVVAFGEFS